MLSFAEGELGLLLINEFLRDRIDVSISALSASLAPSFKALPGDLEDFCSVATSFSPARQVEEIMLTKIQRSTDKSLLFMGHPLFTRDYLFYLFFFETRVLHYATEHIISIGTVACDKCRTNVPQIGVLAFPFIQGRFASA